MNKHDEIKSLIKASRNMLSNKDSIMESNDIRKQYVIINEQNIVPVSSNIIKRDNIAKSIENEIDSDESKILQLKSKKDKTQAYRISGGILVMHGKKPSELELTTDEKIAFQETMNEFITEVSNLVEFNQLNVYSSSNVEWSGKLIEFNIDFIFTIGEENGIYIKGELINTDDDFLELIQKMKIFYEKFKSKWSTVLGNRKLTKSN